MEAERGFKIQTFEWNGQQYLYELDAKGENSILRVYDSRTKLRSTQRMRLPASYRIYTCEQYLLLLNTSQILLYEAPNVNVRLQCKNPGIKQIVHCCYNAKTNLIFIIDDADNLWYLMPQLNLLSFKKLLNLSQHNITGKVIHMCVDLQSTVYLLCIDSILHLLKFDWNKADKLLTHTVQNKIHAIYCKFQWTAIISLNQTNQSTYTIQITRGNDYFKNTFKNFSHNNSALFKATKKDFLFIDPIHKNLIVIAKGQQISLYQFQSYIPQKANSHSLLFQIKTINYNTIGINLHFFQGLRQPFRNIEIPIKWLQPQKQQQLLLYFHNNIHLIFGQHGLSPHFSAKIQQYLAQNQQLSDQKLSCLFLQKLFKYAHITVDKLCNYLLAYKYTEKNQSINANNISSKLARFSLYIQYSLNKIGEFLSVFDEDRQNMNQLPSFQSAKGNYEQLQQQLRCIISFTSKIQLHITTQMVQTQIRVANFDQQYCHEMLRFAKCLQRSKTLYILNKIVYQQLCQRNSARKSKGSLKNSYISQIKQNNQNNENDLIFGNELIKIGKSSCHQFFADELRTNINKKQIFKYLSRCQNFLQAAYFYLYIDPTQIQVPYISDGQTIEMIKFLVQSPMLKVLNNRQYMRTVIKQLPKITSKAFVINQHSFLQYLCSLSVNTSQMRCCLAILLSGVVNQWSNHTQNFVIECFVLCDKALLAYNQVIQFSHSVEERRILMQKFVSLCLKNKKFKDLFDLSFDAQDNDYVQERLKIAFGDEAEQILKLMKQLKTEAQ